MVMLILALAILALLVWLVVKRRERPIDPIVVRAALWCAVAFVGAAVALRAGPVAAGLYVGAVMALVVWLRMRGRDDGPGDDGPDPPDEPDPDPGSGQVLDVDAFDRARSEWERGLPSRD